MLTVAYRNNLTCQLVNLSTRQLQIMITTVKKPTHLFVLLGK